MRILCSRPITAPATASLPSNFELLGNEAALSSRFAGIFPWPGGASEYILRLYLAIVLLWRRRRFDAIVTGRYGEFFALAQSLCPFGRTPHLLMDVEWYANHGDHWRDRLSRWIHRRMVDGANRVQVFCRGEATTYSKRFHVDPAKFAYIPYCADAKPIPDSTQQNFIFTGGLHHRDYRTLFEAVAGLDVEVRIAAPPDAFQNTPPNVKVLGIVPAQEYWTLLAQSRFTVLSLTPGVARCPGVITYVVAMLMGKCVVVNEPVGAADYMEHGHTGFILPPQDSHALQKQILFLTANPDITQKVGENARRAAAEKFGGHVYFPAIEHVLQVRSEN